MKKTLLLVVCIFLLLPLKVYAACSGSSPNLTAASASRADVQDCFTIATYGDTITIPAGDATWTDEITFTKDVKIIGDGVGSTNLTSNFGETTHKAFFRFSPDATARGRIDSLTDTDDFEVAGISFIGGAAAYHDGIHIRNLSTTAIRRVKIHDCSFTTMHRAVDLSSGNPTEQGGFSVFGVFYQNTLNNCNGTYYTGYNRYSWESNPASPGGPDAWYIEDNTFVANDWTGEISGGGQGMAQVLRYNSLSGTMTGGATYWEAHGNQGSGTYGTQLSEIYANNFAATGVGDNSKLRGGQGLIFYNLQASMNMEIREEFGDLATPTNNANECTAGNPQDCSGSCQCQKVANTYIFANHKVSDNSTAMTINTLYDCAGSLTTSNETSCYIYSGVTYGDHDGTTYQEIVENREYYKYSTSFDGTSGVGCGTLASRPATCTTGVGYWATEQSCSNLTGMVGANPATPISGTLYKCVETNTWAEWYKPYTYPHPLRGTGKAAASLGSGASMSIGSGAVMTLQ